jgi:hypothetical protein
MKFAGFYRIVNNKNILPKEARVPLYKSRRFAGSFRSKGFDTKDTDKYFFDKVTSNASLQKDYQSLLTTIAANVCLD